MLIFSMILILYLVIVTNVDPYFIYREPLTVVVMVFLLFYTGMGGMFLLWTSRTKYIIKVQNAKEKREKGESSKSVWDSVFCELCGCAIPIIFAIITILLNIP